MTLVRRDTLPVSEGQTIMWDATDGTQLTTFTGHTGAVRSARFERSQLEQCSLPQIIDHYRDPASPRRGGFFSSGYQLMGWDPMA